MKDKLVVVENGELMVSLDVKILNEGDIWIGIIDDLDFAEIVDGNSEEEVIEKLTEQYYKILGQ